MILIKTCTSYFDEFEKDSLLLLIFLLRRLFL